MFRFIARAIAVFAMMLPAYAQQQTHDWIIPELLAAAKAEGQVTIYSSTNEQEALPMWKLFEEATGIKINYVRGAEGPLHGRIAVEARTGQPILERYGMTEAVMIASNPYALDQRIAGTVGFPLPGVRAKAGNLSNALN